MSRARFPNAGGGVRPRSIARLLIRLPAGLLGLALLTGPVAAGLLAGSAAPADAASSDQPAASESVRIRLDSIEPKAPKPGDLFSVGGSLTTSGPKPLPGLRVRLDIGARLDNRSSLQDAGRQPPAYQRSTAADPVSTTLAAGGAASFTYTVPVDQLGLGRLGVYPRRHAAGDQIRTSAAVVPKLRSVPSRGRAGGAPATGAHVPAASDHGHPARVGDSGGLLPGLARPAQRPRYIGKDGPRKA